MIALRHDCLLLKEPDGTFLPCSAEQLTLEFTGTAAEFLDPELLRHAAAGVLHYFRVELGREVVRVDEFAAALAKVLGSLGIIAEITHVQDTAAVRVADLRVLASGAGKLGELEFFQSLRATVRDQLAERPRRLEFLGLRSCVKQLAGRKHWCPTCEQLEGSIVDFIRGSFAHETAGRGTSLVVR